MGIDLIFRGDGRESSTRFSRAEWDTLARLETLLPDAVAEVVGGDNTNLGEETTLSVAGLLGAIDRIDDFLASRPGQLPYTYAYKSEYLVLKGNRVPIDDDYVTGGMSGIQLPGDPEHYYAIDAGLDACWLTKWAIGPDGKGRVVERRDLRGEEVIETITCGRIEIRKLNDHVGIRAELSVIREFLASLAGPEVTRLLC